MVSFNKKHLIINYNYNNKEIKHIIQGQFALYFNNSGIIKINEYKALIFFLKKNIKFFSKLFIRVLPNIQDTKKSIGIRMGKGKGPINEYYINITKGQILIEFGFLSHKFSNLNQFEKDVLIKRFKKITYIASIKTKLKLKLFYNKNIYTDTK